MRICAVSVLSTLCVFLLLDCKHKLGGRVKTFGDVGYGAMGRSGHVIVELTVVLLLLSSLNMSLHVCVCVCVFMCVHIYIDIHIHRSSRSLDSRVRTSFLCLRISSFTSRLH